VPNKITSKQIINPINFLALGFGSGLFPKMPGTSGSFLALIFAFYFPWLITWESVFIASLVGFYICDYCAKKLGVHDHPAIVWDEFCGIWLTLLLINILLQLNTPLLTDIGNNLGIWHFVIAFMMFRVFDITKPWPINIADKNVNGGVGIMVDDLLAAVYASLTSVFIIWLWSILG